MEVPKRVKVIPRILITALAVIGCSSSKKENFPEQTTHTTTPPQALPNSSTPVDKNCVGFDKQLAVGEGSQVIDPDGNPTSYITYLGQTTVEFKHAGSGAQEKVYSYDFSPLEAHLFDGMTVSFEVTPLGTELVNITGEICTSQPAQGSI